MKVGVYTVVPKKIVTDFQFKNVRWFKKDGPVDLGTKEWLKMEKRAV